MTSAKNAPFANIYWFPVAAAFAAIMLPWSVLGQLGYWPAPKALMTAWGHGHEMVFGYALAVVAGYILGPQSKRYVFSLIVVWLLARISFLLWPLSWPSALCNIAFVVMLLYKTLPVFLRTAKKWRNKSLAVIIIGLSITVAAFYWVNWGQQRVFLSQQILFEAILLLSALMFFMGGRMLGPAVAVYLKSQHLSVADRVQPRLEGAGIIVLALVLSAKLLALDWANTLTALALLAAAAIIVARLIGWQVWRCYARADLMALVLGYSWLAVGWLLIALSLLGWPLQLTLAFHTITVGALGTLTFTVMARGRMHRSLKSPNAIPWIFLGVLSLAAATVLRLSVFNLPYQATLIAASLFWSVAFLVLFLLMLALSLKSVRDHRRLGI